MQLTIIQYNKQIIQFILVFTFNKINKQIIIQTKIRMRREYIQFQNKQKLFSEEDQLFFNSKSVPTSYYQHHNMPWRKVIKEKLTHHQKSNKITEALIKKIKTTEAADQKQKTQWNSKNQYINHQRQKHKKYQSLLTSIKKNNFSSQEVKNTKYGRNIFKNQIQRNKNLGPGEYQTTLPRSQSFGYIHQKQIKHTLPEPIKLKNKKQTLLGPGKYHYQQSIGRLSNHKLINCQNISSLKLVRALVPSKSTDNLYLNLNSTQKKKNVLQIGPGTYYSQKKQFTTSQYKKCQSYAISSTQRSNIVRQDKSNILQYREQQFQDLAVINGPIIQTNQLGNLQQVKRNLQFNLNLFTDIQADIQRISHILVISKKQFLNKANLQLQLQCYSSNLIIFISQVLKKFSMQTSIRQSPQKQNEKVRQKIKNYLPTMKCAFHQNQSLTNFCSCKKCLLPLCPSCIKIHTIQHINMKNQLHPQYQNLNDMIYQLNQDLKDFVEIYQDNFRQINDLQYKIQQFKASILGNINKLRDEVVNQIQGYFNQVIHQTEQKISSVSYIKNLTTYKQETKRVLHSLKQIQKNLYNQNHKLMRTLIKYQASQVQKWLNSFNANTKSFIDKLDGNFCTLSVRQSFKQGLCSFLGSIYKIQINQINMDKSHQPFSITHQLKEFIDKANQKRQIKKSLSHIISKMSNSTANQNNEGQSPSKQQRNINNSKFIKNKQNQSPIAISSSMMIFNDKGNQNQCNQYYSQKDISLKLFSNDRRSFMNHSSQKKHLNLNNTQSFCSADFLNLSISQDSAQVKKTFSKFKKQEFKNQRHKRSGSRSRGLSLLQIQHQNDISIDLQSKDNMCQLGGNKKVSNRANFLGVEQMNLNFITSKTQYLVRQINRKHKCQQY